MRLLEQVFTASVIYGLPWLQHTSGWKGTGFGGWQISDITTIDDGYSLTPGLSISNQGNAVAPNTTGAALAGPKTAAEWFNTGAFTAPAAGYFGDARPGIIRGPGLINFDMTLQKTFKIRGRVGLEFRAEFFNAFNHPQFGHANMVLGETFGAITSDPEGPRVIQLGGRVNF